MTNASIALVRTLVLALVAAFAAGTALADKPKWAGENGGRGEQREEHGRDHGEPHRQGRDGFDHFRDQHRALVHEYYAGEFRSGRCPPGLAKKHDGCMPRGPERKWALGRPLPYDVVSYDVPRRLAEQLGPPPAGHRFVRVASDILLIAVGTSMVVDAINDLGR